MVSASHVDIGKGAAEFLGETWSLQLLATPANDDADFAQLGGARNASAGLVRRSAMQLPATARGSSEGGDTFMVRRTA